jgi:hypothetical protein
MQLFILQLKTNQNIESKTKTLSTSVEKRIKFRCDHNMYMSIIRQDILVKTKTNMTVYFLKVEDQDPNTRVQGQDQRQDPR